MWQSVTMLAVVVAWVLHPLGVGAQAPEVRAAEGWLRPAATGATSQAGLTIQNTSAYTVYVTSATTDAAGRVELRDGGQQDPGRQVVKFIAVPAYGSLAMDAKGPHLVLHDLKRPLVAGETVTLTLRTDQGLNIPARVIVRVP
jgi:copper(I)-binding protein